MINIENQQNQITQQPFAPLSNPQNL